MATYREELLLPGNELTAMAEMRNEGFIATQPVDGTLGGPYRVRFPNDFVMVAYVTNNNPVGVTIALYNPQEDLVTHEVVYDDLERTFVLTHNDDRFIMTIVRSANNTLTDAAVAEYVQRAGIRCPFCGSDELHTGKMQTDSNMAWQHVTCCACEAEWNDQYVLQGIDTTEGQWTPPATSIRQTDV